MAHDENRPSKHYDTVSGIKVKHTRVPKFLKSIYVILAGWAAYYAITATTINDRTDAVTPVEVTAEAGKEIFNTSCAGCHAVTTQRLVGPGLAGVKDRLGDQELENVLHNGRPQRGMPAPPSLGLNDDQIRALKLYLDTLK
ncbi:c-type cytochrome [Effusibacillus consociatus]|uniref:C-type cytochrome n=1 Tax=Effusibacillus consociatus TaxID=1117041 RepID=A0ABV9Q7N0_9BACL